MADSIGTAHRTGPSGSRRRAAPDESAARLRARGFEAARGVGAASVLLALASLLWIPQAGLLAGAVGRIAAGGGAAEVLAPAAGILALAALRAGLDYQGGRLAFAAARARLSGLRDAAAGRLAAVSPIDARRPPSGLAASVLTEEAEAVTAYLARFRPARFRATIVPVAMLLAILPFSWVAALALLVAAPAIPLFMALIGWRAQAASGERLREAGGFNAFLLDRLRGLATIRALGAVDVTAARIRADAERLKAGTMAVLRIAFLSSAVLELFAALGVAMVAVWVGFTLLGTIGFGAWGGELTLSDGLFVLLLAPAFFEPLRELAAVWHDRAAGEAALASLDAIGRGVAPVPGGDTASASTSAAAPAIRVAGLRFTYPGRAEAAIDGFEVTVAAGGSIALEGPSGSGKSTLLAILAGLAAPDAGTIEIGGVRLGASSAPALRAGMAWIGQRPHLLAGSLVRNVSFGRATIDRAAAERALAFARLNHVAAARGAAPIGEGGEGFSGGEALRLAIARAAADPAVRLILADEPTAHLDAATAAEIGDLLVALGRGRSLVIATHDPALAARMDRRVRLTPRDLQVAA